MTDVEGRGDEGLRIAIAVEGSAREVWEGRGGPFQRDRWWGGLEVDGLVGCGTKGRDRQREERYSQRWTGTRGRLVCDLGVGAREGSEGKGAEGREDIRLWRRVRSCETCLEMQEGSCGSVFRARWNDE